MEGSPLTTADANQPAVGGRPFYVDIADDGYTSGYGPLATIMASGSKPGLRPAAAVATAFEVVKTYWSHFTGAAYSFVKEFRTLFPDPSRADWNGVHQWVLELPQHDQFTVDTRSAIFEHLMTMFTETSKDFAKRLIDDSFEAVAGKLSPDPFFGGVAGGGKYREHNKATRLFKFATDVELPNPNSAIKTWMYGGAQRNDTLGMKSAGHELKSAQALIDANIPELFFPLMAVFTYRGKRVTCMSLLPISSDTLVQGSSNGGTTLVTPPEDVEKIMSVMGAALSIGMGGHGIIGPFDMEVHRGRDGKLYIIDAARLFPPEAPPHRENPRAVFYQLLRPELVRDAKILLVPDACTARIPEGPSRKQAMDDIKRATECLGDAIAKLANDFNTGKVTIASCAMVKELLHSRGINMRHLPSVIELVSSDKVKSLLWRCRLEKRYRHDDDGDGDEDQVLQVKRLRAAKSRSREDVERVLACQQAVLSTTGVERMQLVPTLLQLAGFVKDTIPITSTYSDFDVVDWKPSGDHPLVLAWDVCVACDAQLVWRNGGVATCSELTLLTAYLLARHIHLYHPELKVTDVLKVEGWSMSLLPVNHFLHRRVTALLRQEDGGVDEEMCCLFERAASEKRWDVVLSTAEHYGGHGKAAFYCARGGCLELLEYCLWASERRLSCSGGGAASSGTLLDGYFDGETPLHWAASDGSVEAVEYLLKRQSSNVVNVNATSCSGRTPLYKASTRGHPNVVAVLLKYGADVNVKVARNRGSTALIGACHNGHLAVVEQLLVGKANMHDVTTEGRSALHFASADGWLDIVKVLLVNHASVNLLDNKRRSPLFDASCGGHLDIVKYLLENGADQLCADKQGQTPLFVACLRGHATVVHHLLRYCGLDIYRSHASLLGETPLTAASMGGFVDIVECLLDHGVAVNVVTASGWSALFYACFFGHLNVAKHLLWRGADWNLSDSNGETPLLLSCGGGHVKIVDALLFKSKGMDVNSHSKSGIFPLFVASLEGHLEVVNALVNAGADVTACVGESDDAKTLHFAGCTALHGACLNGHLDMAQFLVEKGSSLLAVTKDGFTPAMLAASNGNLDLVHLFPSEAFSHTTPKGLTALHIAVWAQHDIVVQFLKAERLKEEEADEKISHPLWQCNAHDKCSFEVTGKTFAWQASFQCHTCWQRKVLVASVQRVQGLATKVTSWGLGDCSSCSVTATTSENVN